ncbi:MAG: porphobilinogen synthase [Planctomycetaceae bacterium]|nr:porphobilinogen synthase [Planctomycetaceae bacterium]
MNLIHRPRRLRRTPAMRRLVRETRVSKDSLILPFFIREGSGVKEPIDSLAGLFRYSPDTIHAAVGDAMADGVRSFLLFGLPDHKDEVGSSAWDDNGPVQDALRRLRKACPEAVFITDVCMCEYTSHGHCGVLAGGDVDNDPTLDLLARTALSHARAGADIVAPSDMMDGRVGAIRNALDGDGFQSTAIMSYAVKYASSFYGPFREAAGSAPGIGDRQGYQMDPHNRREAGREAALDLDEGADMLIVKPAMAYMDVIADVAAMSDRPVAAYSVSGEYAMICAAGAQGLVDEYGVMCETALGAFRAGADLLITYFARELARAIDKGDLG